MGDLFSQALTAPFDQESQVYVSDLLDDPASAEAVSLGWGVPCVCICDFFCYLETAGSLDSMTQFEPCVKAYVSCTRVETSIQATLYAGKHLPP